MPNFMTIFGYHVYFWSNEGNPLEPLHVHVSKTPHENATKIWINEDGSCKLDSNQDQIPPKILKKIMDTIENFSEEIEDKWRTVFKSEPTYYRENEIERE